LLQQTIWTLRYNFFDFLLMRRGFTILHSSTLKILQLAHRTIHTMFSKYHTVPLKLMFCRTNGNQVGLNPATTWLNLASQLINTLNVFFSSNFIITIIIVVVAGVHLPFPPFRQSRLLIRSCIRN
jgi:hypothetical protein